VSKYECEITPEEIEYLSLAEVALGEEEHATIHLVLKKNKIPAVERTASEGVDRRRRQRNGLQELSVAQYNDTV
jgi:hypothetical protein